MIDIEIKQSKLEYNVLEAYKLIRTNLQFCGSDKKVIVITSAYPNEGKSSVTLNLALSLAEIGKRVILVDADLRESVLLARMNIKQRVKGLSHHLSNQNSLNDVICSTDIKNLHMIFAGPPVPNPSELLNGNTFKDMLKVLRQNYDYVLIDSPPLGIVIDGAIIANKCDGAILVIESKKVSYRFARNVKAQLQKSNCAILGVILNKVNITRFRRYDDYYGNYGNYKSHE